MSYFSTLYSISILFLTFVVIATDHVQANETTTQHPLHEFAWKYNQGIWSGTTPPYNSLVQHVAEQAQIINKQNCSLIYENTMSAMESAYMAAAFIEQNKEYAIFRFQFLSTFFERDFPNATKLSHAEYAHHLYDYMKSKNLVGDEWRRSCWVIFMQWVVHSDEWRNITKDNPPFKVFVDSLKASLVDGLTLDTFVDCLMKIWSNASNFVKSERVEFPKIHERVVRAFFELALPSSTAIMCNNLLIDFK